MKLAAAALTLLALSACGPAEPESAANRFARTENEIAEREKALNSLNAAATNSTDEAVPAARESGARSVVNNKAL